MASATTSPERRQNKCLKNSDIARHVLALFKGQQNSTLRATDNLTAVAFYQDQKLRERGTQVNESLDLLSSCQELKEEGKTEPIEKFTDDKKEDAISSGLPDISQAVGTLYKSKSEESKNKLSILLEEDKSGGVSHNKLKLSESHKDSETQGRNEPIENKKEHAVSSDLPDFIQMSDTICSKRKSEALKHESTLKGCNSCRELVEVPPKENSNTQEIICTIPNAPQKYRQGQVLSLKCRSSYEFWAIPNIQTVHMERLVATICGLLNTHCYATLYFGVDKNGTVIGTAATRHVRDEVRVTIDSCVCHRIVPALLPTAIEVRFVPVELNNSHKNENIYVVEIHLFPSPYQCYTISNGQCFIRKGEHNVLANCDDVHNLGITEAVKLFYRGSYLQNEKLI